MRNSPLERFCCLIALINLLVFYGLALWLVIDRTIMVALATVVTFNLGMGWLLIAGIRRDEAGNRVWTSRPAYGCVLLSVVIAGGLFFSRTAKFAV